MSDFRFARENRVLDATLSESCHLQASQLFHSIFMVVLFATDPMTDILVL